MSEKVAALKRITIMSLLIRARGARTPTKSSAMQIIENVLDKLEPERSKITIVPLEVGEEVETYDAMAKEVPRERGIEAGEPETIEVDSGGEGAQVTNEAHKSSSLLRVA